MFWILGSYIREVRAKKFDVLIEEWLEPILNNLWNDDTFTLQQKEEKQNLIQESTICINLKIAKVYVL